MNERNPYAPPGAEVADIAPVPSAELTEPPFFAVTIFKFVLMSFFTLGLYEVYWFYRNWRIIKERERLDIWPFWRAVFAIFFCYQCFSRIRDHDEPALPATTLAAGPLAAGWIVTTLLYRLPDPYWLITYFSFLFIIPVQRRVNQINDLAAPGHDRNGRLSWQNWIGIVIGVILVTLVFVGAFVPSNEGIL